MKKRQLFLPIITLFFILCFSWEALAQVTLTVEDGMGPPGSSGNDVVISLENQDDLVLGVQLDICDVGDYLTITGIETTSRTEGFDCSFNELENGCARILIFSFSLEPIEEGSGPVLIVKFDVKEDAPLGETCILNLENVSVVDETNHNLEVTEVPGEFCFTSCAVNISPAAKTVNSGETIQFSATNTGDCSENPVYEWEMESEIGSGIDGQGFYTAGNNYSGQPVTDKVTVTDTANNVSATAEITVTTITECRIIIDPSEATVNSGGTIQFSATVTGDCFEPSYAWEVESAIGSEINDDGLYTAGYNNTASPVTDMVTVYDLANNVSASAEITVMLPSVRGSIKRISPEWILGSKWAPTQHYISITGKDTYFDNTSRLSFNPGDDIVHIGNYSVQPNKIIAIILLNTDLAAGYVDVTVTTGIGESYTVTGENMLRIRK